jgi:glycosyltransferase involved in cell wall biosynthesis
MTFVSVIVPCFNEEKTIGLLLNALCMQTYPLEDLEVVVADGLSTDGTRQIIAEFQQVHPQLKVRVVENAARHIPAGLNAALRAARGEVIVRMDAHALPSPEYVERCVAGLQAGKGENVGGVWKIEPGGQTWIARSIAAAAAHPLGVGDARYRLNSVAGEVDTVPFGAYQRTLFERLGGFDESLLSNEDYELNARIRQNGGRIYLDPAIRSTYFARSTLSALARQYFRYGFWKWQMLRRYPQTLRWRQALPPLFILGVFGLAVLALFWPLARAALAIGLTLYGLILLVGSGPVALQHKDLRLVVGIALAIATMHVCWGSGFWWSMFRSLVDKS